MKRILQMIPSLIGAVVLFAALSIGAYWIFAFVYFGATGSFDGLVEAMTTKVPPLAQIPLRPGPFDQTDVRSWSYHALRALGPGVLVLIPSYVLLRLSEAIVPK